MTKNKSTVTILVSFIVVLLLPPITQAAPLDDLLIYYADQYQSPQTPTPVFNKERLEKAQPDECYNGLGVQYPLGPPCRTGQSKVNQSYVWGLSQSPQSQNIWFGTAANAACEVLGSELGVATPFAYPPSPDNPFPVVCEFGESYFRSQHAPGLPPDAGDWRPPVIYEYNPGTLALIDKTPLAGVLINKTSGIRSAGSSNGIVLFAGPNISSTGGLNIFAFKSADGSFINAQTLTEYSDIRKCITVNNVLYLAVKNSTGTGNVLRWTGSVDNPFQFDVVGNMDAMAANIALHEGRLYVTTWPTEGTQAKASLFMSPVIPAKGLTTADAANWVNVWDVTKYEPDSLVATTYAGGDLASFDGWLYWGTMHVPGYALKVALDHALANPNNQGELELDSNGNRVLDTQEILTTALGTNRAISIFRGQNLDKLSKKIELMYGDEYLPVYDARATVKSYTIASDTNHKNKMGVAPTWGTSGIGNFYNTYTWAMGVGFQPPFQCLLTGTFDTSSVWLGAILGVASSVATQQGITLDQEMINTFASQLPVTTPGADLFVKKSGDAVPFVLDSNEGQGNYLNYGIRNMLAALPQTEAQDVVYLGMANPFNLATDTSKPQGGWELIKLTLIPPACVNVSPASGYTTLDVTITGSYTNFSDGVTIASFSGTGITVNSTHVNSATEAVANITIAADAALAARDVTVTTGTEVVTCAAAFTVAAVPVTTTTSTIQPSTTTTTVESTTTTTVPTTTTTAASQGGGGGGGGGGVAKTTSTIATTSIPAVTTTTTSLPKPPPACVTDADCDDGVFCNGVETCSNGTCVSGQPPCGDGQVCKEAVAQCWESVNITATSLKKTVWRPILREKKCLWLVVNSSEDTHFTTAGSSIETAGAGAGSQGVNIDTRRKAFAVGKLLFIPVCVERGATVGQWNILIKTDVGSIPLEETIVTIFQVK